MVRNSDIKIIQFNHINGYSISLSMFKLIALWFPIVVSVVVALLLTVKGQMQHENTALSVDFINKSMTRDETSTCLHLRIG